MSKLKSYAKLIALIAGSAIIPSAAKADFSYTFSYAPVASDVGYISGSFTTSNIVDAASMVVVNSGTYSLSWSGQNYSGNLLTLGTNSAFEPGGMYISANSPVFFTIQGLGLSYTNSGFSGNMSGAIRTLDSTSATFYSGFFQAMLDTGSSSGGGSGSSGGSGGAPSPEVNAGLGMLLAGFTFVFLRRKRGGQHARIAA